MSEYEPVPDRQKQSLNLLALLMRWRGNWISKRQAGDFLDTSEGGVFQALSRLRKEHPELGVETKRRVGFRIKPPEE